MRWIPVVLVGVVSAGCMTDRPELHGPTSGAGCDAAHVEPFFGQPGHDVAATARKAAGARAVRVIGPGDAVTMDFRDDRLNLEIDADGKIVRARCG